MDKINKECNTKMMDTIITTLAKEGIDYHLLPESEKDYLENIEQTIMEIFAAEQKAKEDVAKNRVSVKGVSTRAGLARQTLYNHPVLKIYIEARAIKFEQHDASVKEEKKTEKIRRLKEELEQLHKRDVDFIELKAENERLKIAIKEKDDLIDFLMNEAKYSEPSNVVHIYSKKDNI